MTWPQLVLSVVPPVSAIVFALITAKAFGSLIEAQCKRVADTQKLNDGCRRVIPLVVKGAVAALSLLPSLFSFLASLVTGVTVSGWLVAAILVVSILLLIKPVFLIWKNDFYELNNQADRLRGGRPGRRTGVEVIELYTIGLNTLLILASAAAFVMSEPARLAWARQTVAAVGAEALELWGKLSIGRP